MATYPSSIYAGIGALQDDVDVIHASHPIALSNEIVAIETELGAAPKTIDDTVAPGATPSSVANFLDMIANIVKTMSGAANWYSAAVALATVPTNLIAHTTATSAPSGWAEFTAGRGRVIVGTPSGGTHAGTVGTALTDVQNKTHTHTGPSHTHASPIIANASFLFAPDGGDSGETFTAARKFAVAGNDTGTYQRTLTSASGTGASGTAATSDVIAYIQQLGIIKS